MEILEVMNNPTVDYLKEIMPGQSDVWYQRIAGDVIAGKMPLPKVEGVPIPEALAPPEPTVNAARQRFLDGSKRQSTPANIPVGQPAKAATKSKLERLTHSDKAAAARLAAQVAFVNPGKSEQWCWEKAIFDLERDRH